jgi:hypothetical protein
MLKVFETSGHILFEEIQKYPRWVSWVVRLAMILTILGLLLGYINEKEKTDMAIGLAFVIPVAIVVIYLNSNMRLEKIVTSNGLYYRWKPWHKKFRVIQKEDIGSFYTRTFPLVKYGFGWFPTYGWYHNAGRGEGLQLVLKNGGKFFFSTNEKNLFQNALQNMISSNPKPRMSEF